MNTTTLKIIQWNANGLKGPKREQMIQELHRLNPAVAILCETHWTNADALALQSRLTNYVVHYDNRSDGFGGVAILLKDHLRHSPVPTLAHNHNIQVLGVRIHNMIRTDLTIYSVYCPLGDAYSREDMDQIFLPVTGSSIICGDFNAHHDYWSSNHRANRGGRFIAELLDETPDWTIITPPDLATRRCPRYGASSTIDLAFFTSDIGPPHQIQAGPYWSSDHLPILIELPGRTTTMSPNKSWTLRNDSWTS